MSLSLISAAVVGIALGFTYYSMENSQTLFTIVGVLSVLLPLVSGLRTASKNSKKRRKELLIPVFKDFGFAIVCVSFGLIVAAMTSTKLYCTYGACSEFAGLEILFALMWIPVMTGVSALLTLAGLGILLGLKRK